MFPLGVYKSSSPAFGIVWCLMFVSLGVCSPGISLWIYFASFLIIEIQHFFMVLWGLPSSLCELPDSSLAILLDYLFFTHLLLLSCSVCLSHWFIRVLYISWMLILHLYYMCYKYLPQFMLKFFNFPYGMWWTEEKLHQEVWIFLVWPNNSRLLSRMPHQSTLPPSTEFFISVSVLFRSKISMFSFSLVFTWLLRFPICLLIMVLFSYALWLYPYFLENVYNSCLKICTCYIQHLCHFRFY